MNHSENCRCLVCAPSIPPSPATATPAALFAHLAQLAEANRNSLGLELETLLEPVVAACDTVRAVALPGSAAAEQAHQLRHAIDALIRYEAQVEQLLAYYRYALALAQPLPLAPELAAHLNHLSKLTAAAA